MIYAENVAEMVVDRFIERINIARMNNYELTTKEMYEWIIDNLTNLMKQFRKENNKSLIKSILMYMTEKITRYEAQEMPWLDKAKMTNAVEIYLHEL